MSEFKTLLQNEKVNGIRVVGIIMTETKIKKPNAFEALERLGEEIEKKWKIKEPVKKFLEERSSVM